MTTGGTAAPLSDELAAGLRRSPSPTARATAASIPPGSVSGLPQLAAVDPASGATQRATSNPQSPQQQQTGQRQPTLTHASARHAHELQEAAQQRVLAFVQAQAQACANDAAVGLDMLSLTTPTSGELLVDGRLAPPAQPAQSALTHPAHSQLSNSGAVTGSGEVPVLADARAKTTSGQLGAPISHGMTGSDALYGSGGNHNHKVDALAGGRIGGAMAMQDIDHDPFAEGWEMGEAPMPSDTQNHAGTGCSAALRRGLGGVMQMPNPIHRAEPFSSGPSSLHRRLRHVMEEGVRTTSNGDGPGASMQDANTIARESVSASALLTGLQSESHKYVVQKVFSEEDLDTDRPGSVRARKKRISPGPGRRSSGGLPDMPGPSTALPFLPDLTDDRLPRSADAVLGTGAGASLTSPPHAGSVVTAAERGGSLPSPQYGAQLRQFVHPGAVGGRDTFVRVSHSAGPSSHMPDTSFQHASSSPFGTTGGVHSQPGTFWKVPAQARGGGGGAGEDGGATAATLAGYQGASSNIMGAHVMYQSYANDVKALRSKVNRIDGGIGRKVTLDVLKLQFGKGLKEAADNLGMCPTTLKRACRRLGVKRWPRTAEAANHVSLFSANSSFVSVQP